jgi:serine/threonine protein kinase
MALKLGTKLARYEIRSQLGAGGMGEVYRARDTEIGRDVAVKVLPSAFSADKNTALNSADRIPPRPPL